MNLTEKEFCRLVKDVIEETVNPMIRLEIQRKVGEEVRAFFVDELHNLTYQALVQNVKNVVRDNVSVDIKVSNHSPS